MGFQSVVRAHRTTITRSWNLGRASDLGLLRISEVHESIPRIDDVATYVDHETGEPIVVLDVTMGTDVKEQLRREVLKRMGHQGMLKNLPALAILGKSLLPGGGMHDRLRNLGNAFRISLSNQSERPIRLLAGDLLSGGWVDRVIARDTVVPPGCTGMIVEARCIEGGRNRGSARELVDAGQIAPPSLRQVLLEGTQFQVWVEAGEAMRACGLRTPAASFCTVRDTSLVRGALAGVDRVHLEDAPPGATGLALRLDGEIVFADRFEQARTFARHAERLIESYRLEIALRRVAGRQEAARIEFLLDAFAVVDLRKHAAEPGGHAFHCLKGGPPPR
jgi:hypothetical protein